MMTLTPDQPPPQKPKPTGDAPGKSPWSLMSLGVELGLVTGLFTFGGWWLDKRWGTLPALTLVGLFIGVVGGTYKLWRVGKQAFHE